MKIEDQKFMALEGLHTWVRAVITSAARLNALREQLPAVAQDRSHIDWMRSFSAERHQFLVAANHVLRYIGWAKKLDFLDRRLFSEFEGIADTIKNLRDMNEHVVEYFTGGGRRRDLWVHATDQSISDASSTVDDRIGGRLSWNLVAAAAEKLRGMLPDYDWQSRQV